MESQNATELVGQDCRIEALGWSLPGLALRVLSSNAEGL